MADLKKRSILAPQKLRNSNFETNHFRTEPIYKIIGVIAGKSKSTQTIRNFFN
jgi:hypothetical protein